MKTSQNTVLITGGSAGIGLETARLFVQAGNQVIITGRKESRLQEAAAQLGDVTYIVSDVSDPADVEALAERISRDFPQLNILVNNAGSAFVYRLTDAVRAADKARTEMQTNFFGILDLTERLLPLLQSQAEAAIVNVSSVVSFVPDHVLPTYSASKAALHSYSQSLRYSLAQSGRVRVFELMPPLVDTEFSKEIGGHRGIPPAQVAQELLQGIREDNYEIRAGITAQLYALSLSDPQAAFQALNPLPASAN